MKKLFQKINTKGARSVLLGLVLALSLSFGSSLLVGAVTSIPVDNDVHQFLGTTSSLASRIGSIAIGRTTVPSWIPGTLYIPSNCLHKNSNPGNATLQTCLDVFGGATFANLLINQTAYWNADTVVGISSGTLEPGGGGGFSVDNSTLTVENSGANSGLLVSGLGYFVNGLFSPRNLTTEQTVCARADGTLVRCGVTPLTYYWQTGNWGTCTGVVQPICNGSYQTTNGGVCQGTWQTTGPGSCSGTPINEIEVDWAGNAFDWEARKVYKSEIPHPQPSAISTCPYDTMVRCNNVNSSDGNPHPCVNTNQNCIAALENESAGTYYWPHVGSDHWDRLQLISGITNEVTHNVAPLHAIIDQCNGTTQQSCTSISGCQWANGNPITNYCSPATTQQSCTARNPACSWNPNTTTVSCLGPTTQNACTSQNPSCSFNPGNPGNRSRTVVCKDSNNQTVDQQRCIDNVGPKPPVTEACS